MAYDLSIFLVWIWDMNNFSYVQFIFEDIFQTSLFLKRTNSRQYLDLFAQHKYAFLFCSVVYFVYLICLRYKMYILKINEIKIKCIVGDISYSIYDIFLHLDDYSTISWKYCKLCLDWCLKNQVILISYNMSIL